MQRFIDYLHSLSDLVQTQKPTILAMIASGMSAIANAFMLIPNEFLAKFSGVITIIMGIYLIFYHHNNIKKIRQETRKLKEETQALQQKNGGE